MPDAVTPIIELTPRGSALLLSVAADQLTALSAVDQFDVELKRLLDERSETYWVLDFRGVTFMVTPAINTLLVVMKRLRSAGGDLVLTGLRADIRQIFELMRLHEVLTIRPDAEAALAAHGGQG